MVRVVEDAAPSVGLDAILIYDPLQRRTRAEPIVVDLWRDAVECEEVVVLQLRLVFGEFHLLDAPIYLYPWRLDGLQFIVFRFGLRLSCGIGVW